MPSADHETRDRLLRAATQLFWQEGYGSTSVADVLQMAGVNSGSLYHFFPGKQDLLLAVLALYRQGLEPMLLAPAWLGVDDPIERVFALLARYRQSIVDTDCTYRCPIGSLALEIHEPDPPVRQALAGNFKAWTDAITDCLVAAGARLPAELDLHDLATLVLAVMEGGVMQARTHRDVTSFDASVHQLRAYFNLLLAQGAPPGAISIKPHTRSRKSPPSQGDRR